MSYFLIIIILLGILFFNISTRFKYVIKMCIFFVGVFVCFTSTVIVGFWRPNNPRNFLFASKLAQRTHYLIGLEYEIEGTEFFEKNQSFIVVVNHQCPLDCLTIAQFYPFLRKCAVVTRTEFRRELIYALGGWIGGMIFIDRTYSETTKETLNEAVTKLKEEPRQILIFPEGGDQNTGVIHPFRKGAFHMAIQAGVPIVPVVVSQYTWYEHFKRFDGGKVIIKVLPPVKTDNYTSKNVEELSNCVWSLMTETFNQLKSRI